MKEYSIKELTEKLEEILTQDPQEMLEYELIHVNEDLLCEMTDLRQEDTNLKCIVWADGPRNMKHGFRIKFQNSYNNKNDNSEMIPITISDNPEIPKSVHTKLKIKNKDLEDIKRWIVLNKEVLLKYAIDQISTRQLLQQIKPL